eukprot:gene27581-7215_t
MRSGSQKPPKMQRTLDFKTAGAAPALATPTPSKYAECPVCNRSIPLAFMNPHVDGCLSKQKNAGATPTAPSPAPAATPPAATTGHTAPNETMPSAVTPLTAPTEAKPTAATPSTVPNPPPENTPILVANTNGPGDIPHPPADTTTNTALDEESPISGSDTTRHRSPVLDPRVDGFANCSVPTHVSELSHQADIKPAGATTENTGPASAVTQKCIAPTGSHSVRRSPVDCGTVSAMRQEPAGFGIASQGGKMNAFESLMQSQKLHSRVQCFYVELTAHNHWRYHWYIKGNPKTRHVEQCLPPSQWSASVSVALDRGMRQTKGSKALPKTSMQFLTNVVSEAGGPVTWDSDTPSNKPRAEGLWTGSMSVLKSGLQKAIRLGRGSCAVRLALHILKEDPSELLRRLPIICLEDAILHPAFPLLVWLMVAQSKGYVLGSQLASNLLQITYVLGQVKVRDFLPPADEFGLSSGRSFTFDTVDDSFPLLPCEALMVKCILLRASYGGMDCDMTMLWEYAALWSKRFKDSELVHSGLHTDVEGDTGGSRVVASVEELEPCWLTFIGRLYNAYPPVVELGFVHTVGAVQRSDIPLPSIDFHVSDIIQHMLTRPQIASALNEFAAGSNEGTDSSSILKSAMWLRRSGLNSKIFLQWPILHRVTNSTLLGGMNRTSVSYCESEELRRNAVHTLWSHMAKEADAYSVQYVGKRFKPK